MIIILILILAKFQNNVNADISQIKELILTLNTHVYTVYDAKYLGQVECMSVKEVCTSQLDTHKERGQGSIPMPGCRVGEILS